MSSMTTDGILIDFAEDDWATVFPDFYTVTNNSSVPFYLSTTYGYYGQRTLRSGAIGHSNSTTITINFNLTVDGSIEFPYIVYSENGYDWLTIKIDGTQVIRKSGTSTSTWTMYTQELLAGAHSLVITYSKDGSQSVSPDACGIGYIKLVGAVIPFDSGYLIKANNKIYTLIEAATDEGTVIELSELEETEVTSDVFRQHRFEFIPPSDVLVTLENPEVLYWQDSEEYDLPTLYADLTFTPFNQTIVSNEISLAHESITGIENVTATCEGELIVAVSFDNKQTWKAWNGEQWIELSEEFSGMSKEALEAITLDQWNLLFSNATGFYLRVSLVDTTQSVTEIYVDFSN